VLRDPAAELDDAVPAQRAVTLRHLGFGVAVKTEGPQRGRIGWSGGQGTDFFVDPDGTVGIRLTQVEMGEAMWPLIEQFQSLHEPS
jgi:hypothetical protein